MEGPCQFRSGQRQVDVCSDRADGASFRRLHSTSPRPGRAKWEASFGRRGCNPVGKRNFSLPTSCSCRSGWLAAQAALLGKDKGVEVWVGGVLARAGRDGTCLECPGNSGRPDF
jgi:hypothetical protein